MKSVLSLPTVQAEMLAVASATALPFKANTPAPSLPVKWKRGGPLRSHWPGAHLYVSPHDRGATAFATRPSFTWHSVAAVIPRHQRSYLPAARGAQRASLGGLLGDFDLLFRWSIAPHADGFEPRICEPRLQSFCCSLWFCQPAGSPLAQARGSAKPPRRFWSQKSSTGVLSVSAHCSSWALSHYRSDTHSSASMAADPSIERACHGRASRPFPAAHVER